MNQLFSECHSLVWKFRDDVESEYSTPGPLDAIRFAHTEVMEAMDAQLRTNTAYSRNNDKNVTVESELVDTLYMLLTVYQYETDYGFDQDLEIIPGLDLLSVGVALAHGIIYNEVTFGQQLSDKNDILNRCIITIFSILGENTLPLLKKCLLKIKNKHIKLDICTDYL